MTLGGLPVYLAFILNRCSLRFLATCRCVSGFTPFSASVIFGLSLVAILVKHPELYPCWLIRPNDKIMFIYEFFASTIFYEIGYCMWNSLETLLFQKIPAFLEEHCSHFGEYYIMVVESPFGVSVISNFLALLLLFLTLYVTEMLNFDYFMKDDDESDEFFEEAELAPKCARRGRGSGRFMTSGPDVIQIPPCFAPLPKANNASLNKFKNMHYPKTLRSGKKIY